jgi:hypothetical protein
MPSAHFYRGRRAASIENASLRVTVLTEGGHIAEICDKGRDVNPLWTPVWPTIEPNTYNRALHPLYGGGVDASLLAGIVGHNLCLDIFGAPSPEEATAGMPVHGEASVVHYDVHATASEIVQQALLPLANVEIERRIELHDRAVRIREAVSNPGGTDRPVGWTQHVTLGPPFLKKGVTQFRASATRSKVIGGTFGTADYLVPGAEFEWPAGPLQGGGTADLSVFTNLPASSAFTTHLMDTRREHAFFDAFCPESGLAFGYVWRRADFPWLGIWEENLSRPQAPWQGISVTRGMEFGASPFPESRREMIDRGRLFDTPTFRWIPAASRVDVEYWALLRPARALPEALEWPGAS